MALSLFEGPERAAIDRVTEVFGTRFAASTAMTAVDLVRDNSISPGALAAGLMLAHIKGLAAAMHSAKQNGELDLAPSQVASILFDLLLDARAK